MRPIAPRRLAARIHSALAFRAARLLGRRTVAVYGRWGRFRGYADDGAMLRCYGRTGSWSAGAVALLAEAAREAADSGGAAPLLVDVGAAIGLVCVGVVRQAPGRALAIESDPDTFPHLVHNVAKSALGGRITTHHLAAGAPATAGRGVRMARTPGNGGDSWVVAETDAASGTPLVRLDDLTRNHPDVPLLLKVDVQGYEPAVLAGGGETLRRSRLAVVEFWPYGLRRMGHDPLAFARQLLGAASSVAIMEDEHREQPVTWEPPPVALERLVAVIADGRLERQVEILLKPVG